MRASNHLCRLLSAIGFCLTATLSQAAGLRPVDIPPDAVSPTIRGAIWYPCAEPPGEVRLDIFTWKDCPLVGDRLPLIVVSHGRGGSFVGHHDTAEMLANAGYIVAAISHPGDNSFDRSRSDDLFVYVERPQAIKRLIDFMLDASPFSTAIDRERIGFFGFSRGGYTGLVVTGADPVWAEATAFCQHSANNACVQIIQKKYPAEPLAHDPRIKAAVIADPLAVVFTADSLAAVKLPVQLWASEHGGDGVLPHDVAAVDANLPARHEYRVVSNAGHLDFLPPCPPGLAKERPELCVSAPGFDRAAFHKEFNTAVLKFFQDHLVEPGRH
jgi:predicted dienelactone hydrolase